MLLYPSCCIYTRRHIVSDCPTFSDINIFFSEIRWCQRNSIIPELVIDLVPSSLGNCWCLSSRSFMFAKWWLCNSTISPVFIAWSSFLKNSKVTEEFPKPENFPFGLSIFSLFHSFQLQQGLTLPPFCLEAFCGFMRIQTFYLSWQGLMWSGPVSLHPHLLPLYFHDFIHTFLLSFCWIFCTYSKLC